LQPDRLFCRRECLGRESWVPPVPGIYGWYFDRIPKGVPTLVGRHRKLSTWRHKF